MDVVATLVADTQAAVLVQPSDLRLDAAPPQFAAALARVVGAIAEELAWPAAGAPTAAAYGRDRIDERDQLADVVAVAAGQRDGERTAAPAGDQVVLRAAA